MFIALVNWNKCTGCGACVPSCPVQCFKMSDGKSEPCQSALCIDCGTCVSVCPSDAIAISIGWGGGAVRRASSNALASAFG